MSEDTLYERLGEREAIAAVVDEFYDRVLADETLSRTSRERIRRRCATIRRSS